MRQQRRLPLQTGRNACESCPAFARVGPILLCYSYTIAFGTLLTVVLESGYGCCVCDGQPARRRAPPSRLPGPLEKAHNGAGIVAHVAGQARGGLRLAEQHLRSHPPAPVRRHVGAHCLCALRRVQVWVRVLREGGVRASGRSAALPAERCARPPQTHSQTLHPTQCRRRQSSRQGRRTPWRALRWPRACSQSPRACA